MKNISSFTKEIHTLSLRPPQTVMRLARMGSAHPTRLSFLRIMLRRMYSESWSFDRPVWEINRHGVGRAIYRAIGPQRTYSLVVFSHDLPKEMRSDRVIATAWDATFTLFDGTPTTADLDRLQANVPLQEAGRITSCELSLSRANRSVRLFNYVVERLANGQQPDPAEVASVGYLMRTTAVYGSGKFGAADRRDIADRPELAEPFQVEMLAVWLVRQFTVDIVEYLAAMRGGSRAVCLDPEIKTQLGVGNSTGLGMAPFLVRHPILLNNWIVAREKALARVRALPEVTDDALQCVKSAYRACKKAAQWESQSPIQIAKLKDLRADLDHIEARLKAFPDLEPFPWDALWRWGESKLTLEGQEALLAMMIEPHGDLIDDLTASMGTDEDIKPRIDGGMRVVDLRTILETVYDWALSIDFTDAGSQARFWYVSEEKLEPRLGDRITDAGANLEQPLCVARLARELYDALLGEEAQEIIATFLLRHPEHRFMVRRAQSACRYPYAEVRDNLIAEDMLPINLMRCKLAFFGANYFDPLSDKWVRINLFQGQPYPMDISREMN